MSAILSQSAIQPREPAFTKLIQGCVPQQDYAKAMELWEIMRNTPGLKPNTITYRFVYCLNLHSEGPEPLASILPALADALCRPSNACTARCTVDAEVALGIANEVLTHWAAVC